jgi:hypothetical protein
MCSSFCPCVSSCSLSRGCVSFAGPIMALPSWQQPGAPRSTVSGTAALPTRLPRLSPLLHPLVGCGACASPCAPLARGEKPAGSPEAGKYRGLRLPQSPVPVLRDHRCSHSRSGWGWHAWPGFAHSDLSRPCLPHHLHCSARHPLVPSENALSPDRSGAGFASLWVGPFCR